MKRNNHADQNDTRDCIFFSSDTSVVDYFISYLKGYKNFSTNFPILSSKQTLVRHWLKSFNIKSI